MSLLDIAEILAGETMITPGGCVDAVTAMGLAVDLWPQTVEVRVTSAEVAREPILTAS